MGYLIDIFGKLGYEGVVMVILILGIFIDISPIKINPIKSLFSYIGKWFNNSIQKEISGFKEEVNKKFDQLQKEQLAQRETLDKILSDQDNKEISGIRWEIIDFENSILNGIKHKREEYRHIIDLGSKYQRIIEKSDNVSVPEDDVRKIKECVEFIESHYEKHRSDQSNIFF